MSMCLVTCVSCQLCFQPLFAIKFFRLDEAPSSTGRANIVGPCVVRIDDRQPGAEPQPGSPTGGEPPLRWIHTCDLCGATINGKPAACIDCDAGPYHTECIQRHSCPVTGSPVKSKGPEADAAGSGGEGPGHFDTGLGLFGLTCAEGAVDTRRRSAKNSFSTVRKANKRNRKQKQMKCK